MRSARLLIKKDGCAKYVSHLDMNRCLTRAVRRAGLPIWYTEGFNPHPYLFFPAPLPLGVSSEGEILEVKIDGDMSNEEIFDKMQNILPQGMQIVCVHDAHDDAALLWGAKYEILLDFPDESKASDCCDAVNSVMSTGTLPAQRAGKQGGRKVIKQINVCEYVYRFECAANGSSVKLDTVLACGTVGLNPLLLVSALREATGICEELYAVKRQCFYKKDFLPFS